MKENRSYQDRLKHLLQNIKDYLIDLDTDRDDDRAEEDHIQSLLERIDHEMELL